MSEQEYLSWLLKKVGIRRERWVKPPLFHRTWVEYMGRRVFEVFGIPPLFTIYWPTRYYFELRKKV